MKLKKGDRVWLRIPTNGTIVSVNQRRGYTIEVDEIEKGNKFMNFDDSEVEKIK